jgi:PAS domain S-box-containing protein
LKKPASDHDVTADQIGVLANLVSVGVFRADKDGKWLYVTDHWSKISGYSQDEARGRGWIRVLDTEDQGRVSASWESAVAARARFDGESRLRRANGDMRIISIRAVPLLDASGAFSGHLGVITDATARQRADDAHRELADTLGQRLKELNCLYGISHIVERSGGSLHKILQETVHLLPAAWEHSDITCARLTFDRTEYTTNNFRPTACNQKADIVVHGKPAGVVEICYLEERPARDEGPFLAEERTLINAVAERLGHIAERLQAERLLREREAELRERLTHLSRVSTMGEMATSIAHEVNQPLTAVATYAQACRRMVEAGMIKHSEVLDALTHIADDALRAGDIIHRLRKLVKRQVGKRVPCDVNALVRDLEHLAAVDSRLHDVRLRLELADSLPLVVVDAVQIQQVVLNLVRNGIDAMEGKDLADKVIVVQTRLRSNKEIEVGVSDNGCGLPDGAPDKLFEPFFTTKPNGMGMGLSISRSIILSHGGRLDLSPHTEGGTTVSFTIPVAVEDDYESD